MTENNCPRCGCENFQTLCPDCNFEAEGEVELGGPVIPNWVLPYLELSPDLVRDIAEINKGMYAPGYKLVVKDRERTVKAPPPRRIVWMRPDRVAGAKVLKNTRKQYSQVSTAVNS